MRGFLDLFCRVPDADLVERIKQRLTWEDPADTQRCVDAYFTICSKRLQNGDRSRIQSGLFLVLADDARKATAAFRRQREDAEAHQQATERAQTISALAAALTELDQPFDPDDHIDVRVRNTDLELIARFEGTAELAEARWQYEAERTGQVQ